MLITDMLTKIFAGCELRKSRFHDEKGNFVGWLAILLNGPKAIYSGALRVFLNKRPELPWISYRAIKLLDRSITVESRVLEFGSGMSTIWFAKRAKEVFSVEDNEEWYGAISNALSSYKNIQYVYAKCPEQYSSFMVNDKEGFDLIMIDGSYRAMCLRNAISVVKPGGKIYIDNTDKGSGASNENDYRGTEDIAIAFARQINGKITYFTDFAPTQLFAQQGLMIEIPNCSFEISN